MKAKRIMESLSHIDSDMILEASPTHGKTQRIQTNKFRIFLIAAVVALIAISVGWSYGGRLINFASGGKVVISSENGGATANWEITPPALDGEITEWKNDRLYFIANGEKIDITDNLSTDAPYFYEFTDKDGVFHVIGVGGTAKAESYAWLEYLLDGDNPDDAVVLGVRGENYPVEQEPWEEVFYKSVNYNPFE